jgi:phosphoenolpyruvate carboxylase
VTSAPRSFDPKICPEYDQNLVHSALRHFGNALRTELQQNIDLLRKLLDQKTVMASDPKDSISMNIRASYLEPLHYLQIELLKRIRQLDDEEHDVTLELAMMVTIAWIAFGMRNTG